ncbi:MAG: hypothetical protein PHX30_01365 [Candidatus Pacebacteria bacterium]|nr:hypothetical protein [Candidatus Paceibacterota bacterium]
MEGNLKENMKLLIILLLFVSVYLGYKKFSEPQIPELSSDMVSFSKNVSFGTTINAASAKVGREKDFAIDLSNVEKEISLASDLGAGLVRFDLERRTLESAGELAKLDGAVACARDKKMKVYLAYLGRNSWLGSNEGGGNASWDDFKKEYKSDTVFLMARYKPDYFLILPECPYSIGRQVDSRRSLEEWFNFSKEVGLAIKQISFSTKVALEGTVLSDGAKAMDRTFAERVLGNNDAVIDIFSMNAGSATELEGGKKNLLGMKKKYHWEGEVWMGNVRNDSGNDMAEQEDYFLYSLHLANSAGFSGIILGQLRDGSSDAGGIVAEDFSPKSSYTAINEVMAKRK